MEMAPTEKETKRFMRWDQGPVVEGTTIMYFLSFIALGSTSLKIYNNNNNRTSTRRKGHTE